MTVNGNEERMKAGASIIMPDVLENTIEYDPDVIVLRKEKMKDIFKNIIIIVLGIIIGIMFIVMFTYGGGEYRRGQIDFYNGIMKYKLIEMRNGELRWKSRTKKEIKEGFDKYYKQYNYDRIKDGNG